MSSYATTAEFDVHGIRPEALPATISTANKEAFIEAASCRADSYLGSQFHLPLTAWGLDITQAVCAIAAYELVASLLIFQPEASENKNLTDRRDAAIRWFEQVAANKAHPVDAIDTEPTASSVSRVASKTPRGW